LPNIERANTDKKEMVMLSILADSLMIATRTNKSWVREVRPPEDKARRDRYFWQGRRWRQVNLDDL
jgi:hypothetical protein